MSKTPRPPMKLKFRIPAPPSDGPVIEQLPAHKALVGGGAVHRALPQSKRRLIGGWCFFDHMGPMSISAEAMDVPAHPHIGLQTVTWLLSGAIRHKDSVGSDQLIQPGQLNWMTAGRGIAHSEEGETPAGQIMHGVQMWVALPDAHRHREPAFEHHPALPQRTFGGLRVTVLAGELDGARSPASTYSPLFGAELSVEAETPARLPLRPDFEYGVVVLQGGARIAETPLEPNVLVYLGRGRGALDVSGRPGTRIMLIGGAPLEEPVLLWWNYVFRDPEEALAARDDWAEHRARFPDVVGYAGGRLPAPPPFRVR